ncbi:alkaline shock response membrane anchor protein AmaP [Nonomuraea jiangxiensis]|uniref:Alkaline shock response membrane anchor protein AmaP n=1 Tax=Nonomuraea jiangxiensis TaxID=633440 RepID=A0A1G8ZGT5_9ACTN|nr:alkaline shock response membrane anchor protein AmaP [Nonomuraea jiangxiensis]SDK14271.1 hypothetical protein SAMN05421869_11472 [Nonomuraea jiangxiensis]
MRAQMNRKTARVNRWGLAVVGLVLTILGGLALARALGAFPGSWSAGTPIAGGDVAGFFAGASPWIWWAVALVAIVIALLALRWLFVQGRRQAHGVVRVERSPAGVTEVAAGGMADAVATDAAAGPSVLNADADVSGPAPHVRLRMAADEKAPMAELTGHLSTVTLAHLRDALERDHVPVVARVSLEPSPSQHRMVR